MFASMDRLYPKDVLEEMIEQEVVLFDKVKLTVDFCFLLAFEFLLTHIGDLCSPRLSFPQT